MTKRNLAGLMEWLRPSGIGLVTFLAYALGLGRETGNRSICCAPFCPCYWYCCCFPR